MAKGVTACGLGDAGFHHRLPDRALHDGFVQMVPALFSRCPVGVMARCGDLPALLAALKERQAQRERCERALVELEPAARIGQREIPRLEREIRHRLANWRTMLRREIPEAREILRNLIVGRIVFTPRPKARVYEFSGQGSFGRLLAGNTRPDSVVTPAGFEPAFKVRHALSQ